MFVDHIDRNPKNNHVSNLRYVTPSINGHNTDTTKGHCWKPDKNKWKAYIVIDRKQIHLGYFDTAEEARDAFLEGRKTYGVHTP